MSIYSALDDNLADSGKLLSVELFSAIASNLNYLIDCAAPGKIVAILSGLPGVPEPDPKYWQLCDGSVITEETSSLRGGTTPEMATAGRYLMGTDTLSGTIGGSNTKNLRHNHGGLTTAQNYNAAEHMGEGDGNGGDHLPVVDGGASNPPTVPGSGVHRHTIGFDLSASQNFEPAHIRLKFYIKIN